MVIEASPVMEAIGCPGSLDGLAGEYEGYGVFGL